MIAPGITLASYVPTLVPVLGDDLSHVQFRSLDERLFRTMSVVFDQQRKRTAGCLVGV
ncbi:MAG: hypothetical protein H7067_02365 [Burkholderiales bacterium]|nr:hypothetical protein [Opitutaceae bacterium]